MLIEGQRVVDRDSQTFDAVRNWNTDGTDVYCCYRLFDALSCTGADDDRLCLVRVQGQSIDVEPKMDCVETVGQVRHCFSIVECDVKLCVVCILSVVDPERSDNTSDW